MAWNTAALIARARAENHFSVAPLPSIDLTPAVFGKLLVAAWAVRNGRSDFPDRDRVTKALLRLLGEAPEEVRGVLRVEDRVTGSVLADWAEYMGEAQMGGLVKRYNPDYVRVAVEIDAMTGRHLVNSYADDKPEVRAWVERVVEALSDERGINLDDER